MSETEIRYMLNCIIDQVVEKNLEESVKELQSQINILNETNARLLKTIANQQKSIESIQKYLASFY